jgi:hypothetical protein
VAGLEAAGWFGSRLTDALKNGSTEERVLVAESLAHWNAALLRQTIAEAAQPDEVRLAAMRGLDTYGDKEIAPWRGELREALETALQATNPELRRAAIRALRYAQGAAYVWLGSATGLGPSPTWTLEINRGNALFGSSVASAGDINGDGYGDVIVGAMGYTVGQANEGAAYVFVGSPIGLLLTPAWTVESNHTNATFGFSVASAGDVNGDGYGDVIVGGREIAQVFLGSAKGMAAAAAFTLAGAAGGDALIVQGPGDVNVPGSFDLLNIDGSHGGRICRIRWISLKK